MADTLIPDYYSDPSLEQARTEAATAGTTATNYASAASLLPTKLKEAVLAKVNYNKDIIDQQAKAQAAYFAAPAQAREQYQNIWNPFTREKLVTEARTQAYAPYASLTNILSQRTGSLGDIISAGTGAFNAASTAAQGAYTNARQAYQDLLDIAGSKTTNAKWAYEQTHKTGSGSDLSGITDLLTLILGGNKPTEPSPLYSAPAGVKSPKGQWVSDGQSGWTPTGQTGGNGGGTGPQLVNPDTGEIVEYDSTSDPDYQTDLMNGYQPL